jgi:hypothetical protein
MDKRDAQMIITRAWLGHTARAALATRRLAVAEDAALGWAASRQTCDGNSTTSTSPLSPSAAQSRISRAWRAYAARRALPHHPGFVPVKKDAAEHPALAESFAGATVEAPLITSDHDIPTNCSAREDCATSARDVATAACDNTVAMFLQGVAEPVSHCEAQTLITRTWLAHAARADLAARRAAATADVSTAWVEISRPTTSVGETAAADILRLPRAELATVAAENEARKAIAGSYASELRGIVLIGIADLTRGQAQSTLFADNDRGADAIRAAEQADRALLETQASAAMRVSPTLSATTSLTLEEKLRQRVIAGDLATSCSPRGDCATPARDAAGATDDTLVALLEDVAEPVSHCEAQTLIARTWLAHAARADLAARRTAAIADVSIGWATTEIPRPTTSGGEIAAADIPRLPRAELATVAETEARKAIAELCASELRALADSMRCQAQSVLFADSDRGADVIRAAECADRALLGSQASIAVAVRVPPALSVTASFPHEEKLRQRIIAREQLERVATSALYGLCVEQARVLGEEDTTRNDLVQQVGTAHSSLRRLAAHNAVLARQCEFARRELTNRAIIHELETSERLALDAHFTRQGTAVLDDMAGRSAVANARGIRSAEGSQPAATTATNDNTASAVRAQLATVAMETEARKAIADRRALELRALPELEKARRRITAQEQLERTATSALRSLYLEQAAVLGEEAASRNTLLQQEGAVHSSWRRLAVHNEAIARQCEFVRSEPTNRAVIHEREASERLALCAHFTRQGTAVLDDAAASAEKGSRHPPAATVATNTDTTSAARTHLVDAEAADRPVAVGGPEEIQRHDVAVCVREPVLHGARDRIGGAVMETPTLQDPGSTHRLAATAHTGTPSLPLPTLVDDAMQPGVPLSLCDSGLRLTQLAATGLSRTLARRLERESQQPRSLSTAASQDLHGAAFNSVFRGTVGAILRAGPLESRGYWGVRLLHNVVVDAAGGGGARWGALDRTRWVDWPLLAAVQPPSLPQRHLPTLAAHRAAAGTPQGPIAKSLLHKAATNNSDQLFGRPAAPWLLRGGMAAEKPVPPPHSALYAATPEPRRLPPLK